VWTTFRGPGGNGIATVDDVSSVPLSWDGDSGQGIAWKVETPRPGFSSPIVWGDKVFITGADREQREIYCYGLSSGELMWRHEVGTLPGAPSDPPRLHPDTGFAPNTMTTDGSRLLAIFPTGDLLALDMEGERLWATNLGLPDNHFGHSSSLVTDGRLLFVQYDQHTNGKLMALDPATGETVWQVPRPVISWSSPILVDTGSRRELILTDGEAARSYDPRTGAQLWSHSCLAGDMGPSAAFADGWVFVANDYAVVAGIRLSAGGGEVVWEHDEDLPDTASPVAANGLVFFATSYGYLVCLDAATGEVQWSEEPGAGFYASPIIVGDRLYALDLEGVMHVLRVSRTYELLATSPLGEMAAATPAVLNGRLVLRGERHLYLVTGSEGGAAEAGAPKEGEA
jgi:outer membrane protein assembly factor BamB